MNSQQIRSAFLAFFKERGHAVLPSASLVTTDEKGVTDNTLFNTAGMQPLIPYLLGAQHKEGTRLASSQKCLRTTDIDSVGDNTHATFFEMLGNWSLGDYFKKEAIEWSFEFLTSKEKGLGLDPRRLYVTVFEGDENAPKDEESYVLWKDIFARHNISGERIYYMGAKSNWWSAGDNGPCGPDTEMFYDLTGTLLDGMTREEYMRADDEQKVVEVWNDVFMEYEKKDGRVVGKLPRHNVDTGAGLERLLAVLSGARSIFDTDVLAPLVRVAEKIADTTRAQRIIADHIRTSVFLIADGVTPSNTDRGYILRRLLRRAVLNTRTHNIDAGTLSEFLGHVSTVYGTEYPEITAQRASIESVIHQEVEKFRKTLSDGIKQFEKIISQSQGTISGTDAFVLFSTYGFPIEMTQELAQERGVKVDMESFKTEFSQHQERSRAGAEQKFKGGLAGTDDMSVRYHTATHLLHQALRDVLGEHVEQRGSNITPERLRFDFTHPQKMTDEEKRRVEEIVNQKITASLPVHCVVLPKDEALRTGARHLFNEKYGDEVSVYIIGDTLDTAYSKEFCGGPHVNNTRELGVFSIVKEEAVSSGVRRIKAILSVV